MVDLRTPSSPHSTLWSTTSATPARKQSSLPDPMPRSVPARSSLSPSSPDGLASGANGTSTAMQAPACEMPFLPCPIARNSTALCATTSISHRGSSLAPGGGDVKAQRCSYEALDRARRCPSGMQSAEAKDGWPVVQTSDGAIAWDGRRVSVCSWPSILRASSRVLASVPLRPPTSRWPRPSSPCAIDRTLGCRAWDRLSPGDPTWLTRALRVKRTIGAGCNAMECASFTRPSATA